MVQHLFNTLFDAIEEINQKINSSSSNEKKELSEKLQSLRLLSDEILDKWLLLEEKIGNVQEKIVPAAQPIHEPSDKVLDINWNLLPSFSENIPYRKGLGYFQLFMYEDAIKYLEEVVQDWPELELARLYLAYSYLLIEQTVEALRHFTILHQTSNDEKIQGFTHNALGCIYGQKQQFEEALFHFSKAEEILNNNAESLYNKALTLFLMREYDPALREVDQFIQICPEDLGGYMLLISIHEALGQHKYVNGLWNQLLKEICDPYLLKRAILYFSDKKNYQLASFLSQKWVEIDPGNPTAHHYLGWHAWLLGNKETGVLIMKKAISLNPRDEDILFSYGWILFQMNDFHHAMKVMEKLINLQPNLSLAFAAKIMIYLKMGLLKEAEEFIHSLSDQTLESHPLVLLQYGKIKLQQGFLEDALQLFSDTVQKDPNIREGYLFKGYCYYQMKRFSEAIQEWEKLMTMG
ncbi:tetratricopeptide repeat protein [Microaerobacter geothermalis]|uniref:tetratricopeptide repeat protein n=1 Tax=Microaerobacter geothermalis TaxID=674972 RepID=UPI001F36C8E8|nr:tetratricopeptide repeat protein [Microaerobacter geothermalis]MCF6093347.1 tetratricopeptide repeat protein [Microaerobacter geothermalis]